MSIEKKSVSNDNIPIDFVLKQREDDKNLLYHPLNHFPFVEPWHPHVFDDQIKEEVIGITHIDEHNGNLISSDYLDDALEDFLASISPLDINVEFKKVDGWINTFINKDLNEWVIHLNNFLRLDFKICSITPITIPKNFEDYVSYIISLDLIPKISWGEVHYFEESHILHTMQLFHWEDSQKFRLLLYDRYSY